MRDSLRKPPRVILSSLRYRSHSGRLIRKHRALRTLDFERASFVHPLLLLVTFYAILIPSASLISQVWSALFAFWLNRLDIQTTLLSEPRSILGLVTIKIPYPDLTGAFPTPRILLSTVIGCIAAMAVAYLSFRRALLPLSYFIWGLCLVQLMAVVFFYVAPEKFPHSIATHIANCMESSAILIYLVPCLLSFSYYLFDHSLAKKIIGTALIIATMIVVVPFQYLAHTAIAYHFSLLFMPVLFTVFGLLYQVGTFVALYGWVVSWEP